MKTGNEMNSLGARIQSGFGGLFRPPRIYALLAELCFLLFVLNQLITVVPYENAKRDHAVMNIVTAVGFVLFIILTLVSWKKTRATAQRNKKDTGQQDKD